MVCCIKRHFDAQRFDSAGRNAVRLQKCLILLTMHAFVFFFLSVMGCPIFSTIVLLLSLTLITIGYAGARRRHVGLLRTYNALVTFVFVFVATFLFLSIVLGGAAAVAAGSMPDGGDMVEVPADEVVPYDESSPSIVPVSAQRALHASMRAVMPRMPSMVRPHLASSLRTLRITAPTAVVSRMQAPMPAARAVLGRHGHHGHHNQGNENPDHVDNDGSEDVLPMDDVLPPGAIPADAVEPAQDANAAFVGAVVASIVVVVLFVVIAVMAFLFLFIMPLVVVLLSLFFSGVTIFHLKKLRNAGVCSGACELPTVMPVAMPMMEPAAVRSEKGSPDAPYTPVYMPVSMQMFPPANGMAANPYSGVVYVPVTTYPGAQQ